MLTTSDVQGPDLGLLPLEEEDADQQLPQRELWPEHGREVGYAAKRLTLIERSCGHQLTDRLMVGFSSRNQKLIGLIDLI